MVKRLITVAVLALAWTLPANAAGFQIDGYHASPLMQQWVLADAMPLPPVKVWVGYGSPMSPWRSHTIYLPSCCTLGWTHHAIQGLLFHELGHVFDRTNMTAALRDEFKQLVGVPIAVRWWRRIQTVRWVVNDHYYITISPGEMFAEEYAACSLGLTQLGYQEAEYNSYGWVPPQGTDEPAICALIQQAGQPYSFPKN